MYCVVINVFHFQMYLCYLLHATNKKFEVEVAPLRKAVNGIPAFGVISIAKRARCSALDFFS